MNAQSISAQTELEYENSTNIFTPQNINWDPPAQIPLLQPANDAQAGTSTLINTALLGTGAYSLTTGAVGLFDTLAATEGTVGANSSLACVATESGSTALVPEYVPGTSESDILALSKGSRPPASDYLTPGYQDAHAALFDSGAVRIQPSAPTGTIGRTETWVLPPSVADDAIAQAGGDVGKLEQLLGLDPGYLGSSPVRVDIPAPTGYRIPTGNEFGANNFWRPGGLTWPGGLPEAVIDPVPVGSYVVKPVF